MFLDKISSIGPSILLKDFQSSIITLTCVLATTLAAQGSFLSNALSPK